LAEWEDGWAVLCFAEPGVRELGPTYLARILPATIGRRRGAWARFCRALGWEDTPARRRWAKAKGFRVGRVRYAVRLAEEEASVG
jgi:hypothetical protein